MVGRYSSFSHFTSFSSCVSRCVSPLCVPGGGFASAHRPDRSVGASSSKRLPGETQRRDTTGAIAFPRSNRQISRNPISSAFSGHYFSLAAPMRLSISQLKSPQVLSHLLLVIAIFPFPCAIRFPKSNRQISTSPISSAFSGR